MTVAIFISLSNCLACYKSEQIWEISFDVRIYQEYPEYYSYTICRNFGFSENNTNSVFLRTTVREILRQN